jgi:hypothetical protein
MNQQERRNNLMNYRKPELNVLGQASEVIESTYLKNDRPSDGTAEPQKSAAAYDLDE